MSAKWAIGTVVGAGLSVVLAACAWGHCDTTGGPVMAPPRGRGVARGEAGCWDTTR